MDIDVIAPAESPILDEGWIYGMDDREWMMTNLDRRLEKGRDLRDNLSRSTTQIDAEIISTNGKIQDFYGARS